MPEFSSTTYVKIASDNREAYLYLSPPEAGEFYSSEQISEYLKKQGVTSGIIYSSIEAMTKKGVYFREVKVAEGTKAVNGINGSYEFKFSLDDVTRKPIIRSDGSVDYQSMSLIENTTIGDVLAIYHPPVPGEPGVDVRGKVTKPKPARDLPALRGTGFIRSDDGLIYTATAEGKIEYREYHLDVKDVYEVHGDVDLIVGKIDFRGDVIISGNVESGVEIRATKSITINGHVEAANLIAAGDVIIRKGMQGGQKARIIAGGSVYAEFIEFTRIEAGGSVHANIIMNSEIRAGDRITVSGRRGSLVGGKSYAVTGISAANIGNGVALKTLVSVGVSEELLKRQEMLSAKVNAAKISIRNADEELSNLQKEKKDIMSEGSINAKISQLQKKMMRENRLIERVEEEQEKLTDTLQRAVNATVRAERKVYAGAQIIIDDQTKVIEGDTESVEFKRETGSIGVAVRMLTIV